MGNCFWCYFRQLFRCSAVCKRDFNMLNIILVQDVCPLKKLKIARFLSKQLNKVEINPIRNAPLKQFYKAILCVRPWNDSFRIDVIGAKENPSHILLEKIYGPPNNRNFSPTTLNLQDSILISKLSLITVTILRKVIRLIALSLNIHLTYSKYCSMTTGKHFSVEF